MPPWQQGSSRPAGKALISADGGWATRNVTDERGSDEGQGARANGRAGRVRGMAGVGAGRGPLGKSGRPTAGEVGQSG